MPKSIKFAILFVLIGVSIVGLSTGYEYIKTGRIGSSIFYNRDMSTLQTGTIQVDQFTAIDIRVIISDITIQEGSEWSASYALPESTTLLTAEVIRGVLTIKTEIDTPWWEFRIGEYLSGSIRITVPKGTNLSDISITTISGDITLLTSTTENLSIQTISGDIEGTHIIADQSHVQTSSGEIELLGFTTNESVLETISGDVDVEEFSSESLHLTTSSGDVEIQGEIEKLIASTISGDVDLRGKFSQLTVESTSGDYSIEGSILRSSSITTISGDVELILNELPSVEIETISGSSRVLGKKSTAYFSDNPETLSIKTTSGDIEITTK